MITRPRHPGAGDVVDCLSPAPAITAARRRCLNGDIDVGAGGALALYGLRGGGASGQAGWDGDGRGAAR